MRKPPFNKRDAHSYGNNQRTVRRNYYPSDGETPNNQKNDEGNNDLGGNDLPPAIKDVDNHNVNQHQNNNDSDNTNSYQNDNEGDNNKSQYDKPYNPNYQPRNYNNQGGGYNNQGGGGYNRNYNNQGGGYNREGGYNQGGGYNNQGGGYKKPYTPNSYNNNQGGDNSYPKKRYDQVGGYNNANSYNRETPYNREINVNKDIEKDVDSTNVTPETDGQNFNRGGNNYTRTYNRDGANTGGGYNRSYNNNTNNNTNNNAGGGGYNRTPYNRDGGNNTNNYNRTPYNREGGNNYNREGGNNQGGGGYNRNQGGGGYNQGGGGYNRNQGGGGYNQGGNNQGGGYNRNQGGGGGYNQGGNNQGGGYNRNQGGGGYNLGGGGYNQGGGGYNRNQGGGGYNQGVGGGGYNRNQGGGGYNRNQGGGGFNQGGGGYNRNQGGGNNRFGQNDNQKRRRIVPYNITPTQVPTLEELPAVPFEQLEEVRLNRYIAKCGICARRDADDLIKAGRVKVNGEVVDQLGVKVRPHEDIIECNGKVLKVEKRVYVLYNKPKHVVCTVDDQGRETVITAIQREIKENIFPVGRLERDTTGLIILTNDNDLTEKLTHPDYGVRKHYHVTLSRIISDEDKDRLKEGIQLEDGFANVDKIDSIAGKTPNMVMVEIHESRHRLVERLFSAIGARVEELDRVMFATLTKKALPRGHWRYLSDREIGFLKMLPTSTGTKQSVLDQEEYTDGDNDLDTSFDIDF